MSLQILSDLHLEAVKDYGTFEITPKAPYLALIGDIGSLAHHRTEFLDFLTRQLARFRAVLFVAGNHEAYSSSWGETLKALREFGEQSRTDASLGEFVLLDRGAFRLPESKIIVLGCSLFSRVPEHRHDSVSNGINDFRCTKDWDVVTHNDSHARDLAWLNATVSVLQEEDGEDAEIVILTHWSPSTDARAVDPRHRQSPIGCAFSTDLSQELCFASPKTKVWVFGHTHYNCDFMVERSSAGPLRIVANQRGYYFAQASGFDPEKVIYAGR